MVTIGCVRLDGDACAEVGELGFDEHPGEQGHGEIEVAVFLDVQGDELVRHVIRGNPIEGSQRRSRTLNEPSKSTRESPGAIADIFTEI